MKNKDKIMIWRELDFDKKKKLAKRVGDLESLVMALIDKLGYAVTIDDLNPEWQYPEIIKKEKEKDE